MRILITGANGRTGRAVTRALTARGAVVRAFIRAAGQWPTLQALGHASEHAVGNMADRRSIHAALAGCDALVYIGPPMHPDEALMSGHFIAVARELALHHFVYYSVMHPLRREVRHHRLKLDAEQAVVESGLRYSIVQPMRYMQHLEPIWQQVCEQGMHAMPFNTQARFNVVDLEDLAEATAIVATNDAHAYASYELAGPEALSQQDMAAIISEVIGRRVEAQQLSSDEMLRRAQAAGLSADRQEQMTVMNRHYDQHGFRGNANVLRMVLGREPTRFREYVQRLWSRRNQ